MGGQEGIWTAKRLKRHSGRRQVRERLRVEGLRRGAEGVRRERLVDELLVCAACEGLQERSKQVHINRLVRRRRREAQEFSLGDIGWGG